MDNADLLNGDVKDLCDQDLVNSTQLLIKTIGTILPLSLAVIMLGSEEQYGPEKQRAFSRQGIDRPDWRKKTRMRVVVTFEAVIISDGLDTPNARTERTILESRLSSERRYEGSGH